VIEKVRWRRFRLVAVGGMLAAGMALSVTGCFSSAGSDEQSAICPSAAAGADGAGAAPAGIALVGENRLVRVSLESGRVEAERTLPVGGIPSSGAAAVLLRLPGQLLVQPQTSGGVLVLVRRGPGGRDEILAVNPITLRTGCRYPLKRGVRYRGLAVGASGRIYAYGYGEGDREGRVAAVLTTLEPGGRQRPVTETVRRATNDWLPYWGTVSPDERHAALSYHGSDTTGADWLDAAGGGFRRCRSGGFGIGCVAEVHGAVAPYGAGFIATTGSGLVEVSWNGRVERLPVRPRNVHLMDFVLDASRGLAYVSSCGNRPTIQRLDLARMRVRKVASGGFCGLPLAVYGDRFLVLAASPVDAAGYPEAPVGRLRVLDLRRPGSGVPVRVPGTPQDAIALDAGAASRQRPHP
jgi:hypothetical protein